MNDLIANVERLHTTELGIERIKRNLCLNTDDVVAWSKQRILSPDCSVCICHAPNPPNDGKT